MTLDMEAIKKREGAASPGPWVNHRFEGEAAKVGYYQGGCWNTVAHVVTWEGSESDAAFIAAARSDVPDLVAEVERLTGYLTAIYHHGSTIWADSSCGSGGAGGQTITATAHGEVVQHLVQSALQGVTVKEAADAYAKWVPGTSRLDEPAKRPRRAGPDGRPV